MRTAGLQNTDPKDSGKAQIKLIDVGIGCGDQTLYLTRLARPGATTEPRQPLIKSYVGVTIAPPQAEFAQQRVRKAASSSPPGPDIKIFAADAADPTSWNPELAKAVGPTDSEQTKSVAAAAAEEEEGQTWLLALDTLYHFKPSRKPLLQHACRDMQASFMAFDLLLADRPSFFDKLVLRLMCLLTGIPFSNFLRREQYEDILVDAGYERDLITMEDISEHVFSGIAGYIYKKDALLKTYGMSMGKFRGPAKVFNWWAKSGLVRGYIVVARHANA